MRMKKFMVMSYMSLTERKKAPFIKRIFYLVKHGPSYAYRILHPKIMLPILLLQAAILTISIFKTNGTKQGLQKVVPDYKNDSHIFLHGL